MFEWPWTKAKRQREEERRRAQLSYGRGPATTNVDSGLSDLYLSMQMQAMHNQMIANSHASYVPPSEIDRSGDYGSRDHTGFKTGGGFGGESNHYGGSMGDHSSSSSSSYDSGSSYSSSDSGSSSSDSGGGGGVD